MTREPEGTNSPRRSGTLVGQTSGMGGIEDSFEDLATRLADIAADMDDLAFAHLREAAAGGEPAHLAAERRLIRARRAVARAVAALQADVIDGIRGT